jgi:hypothetical protein
MKKVIFILIVVCIGFTLTVTLEGLIDMNDIVPVFPGTEQAQIEGAVIEGAICFLEAKSQSDLLLKEYEKSARQPFNFPAALDHTEKAVAELEKALEEYEKSITVGKQAGYVSEIIQKFKNFDYDAFASGKQLNHDIMVLVKSYFSGGNILGAYRQNLDHIGEILITLEQIKEKLTANQLPDISLFWQLTQQFSKASLFGNYCTMTAAAIFAQ